jgi:four helix bundle protein
MSKSEAQLPFAHEKLDVYHVAIEFLEIADAIARVLPKTKGQLGDQLLRACEGVILRIAEGMGASFKSADQKRYFRSARGSALECAAVLDICRVRRLVPAGQIEQGRTLLGRIVSMLTRLSQS